MQKTIRQYCHYIFTEIMRNTWLLQEKKKTKTHPVFDSNFTDKAVKSKSTSRKTVRLVSGPTFLSAWPGRDGARTDAAGSKVGLWNPRPSFTKEMSAKRKSFPKTTGSQREKLHAIKAFPVHWNYFAALKKLKGCHAKTRFGEEAFFLTQLPKKKERRKVDTWKCHLTHLKVWLLRVGL